MKSGSFLLSLKGTLIRDAGSTSVRYPVNRPLDAGSARISASSRATIVMLCLWLALFLTEVIASISLCGGRLVFSLDDPYIHLAVADHILSGGYGVNADEFSSPSSSILWPYLLALTEALHLGVWGPLLINASAAAGTLVVVSQLFAAVGMFDHPDDRPVAYAAGGLMILV